MPETITVGFEELEAVLKTLDDTAAQAVQNTLGDIMASTKEEILRRSTLTAEARRRMSFALRTSPATRFSKKGAGGFSIKARGRKVSTLAEVKAEIFSTWKGQGITNPAEGAAARIERSIGPAQIRPKRRRFLLIPAGDFVTKGGRGRTEMVGGQMIERTSKKTGRKSKRRVGGRRVSLDLAALPGTFVVKTGRGLRLMQRLEGGARGRFEKAADAGGLTKSGRKRKISAKKLGARTRLVAVLVKSAKQARPLDFFGTWESLAADREARFDAMLDGLIENAVASAPRR